jgi:hypothetical protein
MKKKYGEYATAIARADSGEEVRVRVKVEGNKTVVPNEIVNFSDRVGKKLKEEEAKKDFHKKAVAEENEPSKTEPKEDSKKDNVYDIASQRSWSSRVEANKNTEHTAESSDLNKAEENVSVEFTRIQEVDEVKKTLRLSAVRDELAAMTV